MAQEITWLERRLLTSPKIAKKQRYSRVCCSWATNHSVLVCFRRISFAPPHPVWFNTDNFPKTGVGPELQQGAMQATALYPVDPEPYV